MKKGVIAVLFVLVALSAFSQAQVAIGIKGGLNFANIDASSLSAAYNSRTGYHAGAFVLVKLTKIGIQPEILFSKQGTSVSLNGQNLNANFDYVNIPVIVKLYTIAGINLQLGPQIGFIASANQDRIVNNVVQNVDVKSLLKSTDFSLALGLGWDAPFGLTFDGRYNLGLSDNNNDPSATSGSIKNQVFQFSVGYKLFKFGN
jgi:hypothetical protein